MRSTIPAINHVLTRYSSEIQDALRTAVMNFAPTFPSSITDLLETMYGYIGYHQGWVDEHFLPQAQNTGKLLRPTLLLLAYEAVRSGGESGAGGLERALPAAVALELLHNFSLLHDDIEDEDRTRRHRPTVWALWGVPLAINTGDGLYTLSRLALWNLRHVDVETFLIVRLGQLFDRTCLGIIEGQHLDLSFEKQQNVTIAMYQEMITRKTALLIACATEMGGLLGTDESHIIEALRQFGMALGMAFQVRDDIAGVWATRAASGKNPAGDIYRRKKSLPIIHALQEASPEEQRILASIYQQEGNLSNQQVVRALKIFEQTQSQSYCQDFLMQLCHQAREALARVPRLTTPSAQEARAGLESLVDFLQEPIERR